MSGWLNLCQFIGNVGRDPETRYQQDGGGVTRISIAVNETWKDKNGDKQERVTWIPVVCFGKLSELVAKYVKKGDPVYVQGRYSSRSYEKDGETKWTTEVLGDKVLFLGKRDRADEGQDEAPPAKAAPPRTDKRAAGTKFEDLEDDIPF